MTRTRIGVILFFTIIAGLVIYQVNKPEEVITEDSAQSIVVAGSTSVGPLFEKLGNAYHEENPNIKVEVNANGSSAGIEAAINGTADIGMSSRSLDEEELAAAEAAGLQVAPIAIDGIAVVVHPDNPVDSLTSEQVHQIYTGEITNWSEVGGNDAEINVYSRETGSGTRDAFEELFYLDPEEGEGVKPGLTEQSSAGAIAANISRDENAIGYVALNSLSPEIKGLEIDGAAPSKENIDNGTYKIYRTFYILYDPNNAAVQDLIDWIYTEDGGKPIIDDKYISVDKEELL